jgi:exodeoxyribonuclease-3
VRYYSWNVNGIRACARKGFLTWLAEAQPDVLGLQEIKASPDQLDADLLRDHGYHVVWNPAERKGYSGTATFSKVTPDEVVLGLGEDRFDCEGRTTITRFGDVTFINAYFPNGKRDLSRIPYKTDFYRLMLEVANARVAAGQKVIIAGDWNTAHHEIDLKNWRANRKTTGFRPEERALLDEFEAAGWVDSFRTLHPEAEERYSWWSNQPGVRKRNVGWRIDYHWVSANAWPSVKGAEIHPEVMGSDHCPVSVELG